MSTNSAAMDGKSNGWLARAAMEGGKFVLRAAGQWTAANAARLEQRLDELATGAKSPGRARLEMGRVEKIDTYGLWLLERLLTRLERDGKRVEINGLKPRDKALLERMARLERAGPEDGGQQQAESGGIAHLPLRMLEHIGRATIAAGRDIGAFAGLFGETVAAMGRAIAHPRHFRLTAAINQLDRSGWQAVPIILLITFLIGAIIAQQGIFHFRKFGAELYVVDMVSILVLREIGVLLVAIMVAGRSGSAFTAELGAMKMREEIDALRTMGHDPVDILILPRVLALIIGVTLLTFIGSLTALVGGGITAWLYAGMSPDLFIERLRDAVSLDHFKVGMIKAPFMGAVIGVIAATEGLRVRGSAQSLGRQTTRSVVKSIFMVIVLDGLFAIFFASIGI